jgi:hypothetical protein
MITAEQIIDFAYESDLVDGDDGVPLGADDINGLYEIMIDPGFCPQREDLKAKLAQMIRDYREGK